MTLYTDHQKEWQAYLLKLEKEMKWDEAVVIMQEVIKKNPDDMWGYISFIYMLMNVIVEPHDGVEYGQEPYRTLAQEYFEKSYPRIYTTQLLQLIYHHGLCTYLMSLFIPCLIKQES